MRPSYIGPPSPLTLPHGRSIPIKPGQLPSTLLDLLPRLHAHVEDRTILTGAQHLRMHAPLTALTLGPQPGEPHL